MEPSLLFVVPFILSTSGRRKLMCCKIRKKKIVVCGGDTRIFFFRILQHINFLRPEVDKIKGTTKSRDGSIPQTKNTGTR
jgi:hypothetical protein